MYSVRFENVTKHYALDSAALDHVDLTVEAGEIFSFVGPSGCGKTTALRIVAGLESPSSGRVHLDGNDITHVKTQQRHFGMVTQQNQLMNHLTAGGNISFPMEVQQQYFSGMLPEKVRAEAEHFGIAELLDRRPNTLSEGQRRRVQLARAVISWPSTLLMDEPLGNLEDRVRLELRHEILRVHHERNLTSLVATASQHDAMAMSDRIAVLFDGVIEQVGTTYDVFHEPATTRVAAFFGEPAMNLLPARVRTDRDARVLDVLGTPVRMWSRLLDPYVGQEVTVGVRPADFELGAALDRSITGTVTSLEPLGHETIVDVRTMAETRLRVVVAGRSPAIGTTLDLGLAADRLHLFDPGTGLALLHPTS